MDDSLTYYDILDITSDASPQDVREAYIKTKATYNRDSVALYTLISPEEREETLKKIEEAYQILSDPEKRRHYDENYGEVGSSENPFAAHPSTHLHPNNVISIDRVPPMEATHEDNLLVPPKTDFTGEPEEEPVPPTVTRRTTSPPPVQRSYEIPASHPHDPFRSAITQSADQKSQISSKDRRLNLPDLSSELLQILEKETEWKGVLLRKVRDAYKISIEEMADITKVTKTYLLAIEEENYAKLPAVVYVRGFVIQMAKVLRLPHEKVATAYLSRYYRNRSE